MYMTLERMYQTFNVLPENHVSTSILRPNQLSMESRDRLHQKQDNEIKINVHGRVVFIKIFI